MPVAAVLRAWWMPRSARQIRHHEGRVREPGHEAAVDRFEALVPGDRNVAESMARRRACPGTLCSPRHAGLARQRRGQRRASRRAVHRPRRRAGALALRLERAALSARRDNRSKLGRNRRDDPPRHRLRLRHGGRLRAGEGAPDRTRIMALLPSRALSLAGSAASRPTRSRAASFGTGAGASGTEPVPRVPDR